MIKKEPPQDNTKIWCQKTSIYKSAAGRLGRNPDKVPLSPPYLPLCGLRRSRSWQTVRTRVNPSTSQNKSAEPVGVWERLARTNFSFPSTLCLFVFLLIPFSFGSTPLLVRFPVGIYASELYCCRCRSRRKAPSLPFLSWGRMTLGPQICIFSIFVRFSWIQISSTTFFPKQP